MTLTAVPLVSSLEGLSSPVSGDKGSTLLDFKGFEGSWTFSISELPESVTLDFGRIDELFSVLLEFVSTGFSI